jgi:hypothetical protein
VREPADQPKAQEATKNLAPPVAAKSAEPKQPKKSGRPRPKMIAPPPLEEAPAPTTTLIAKAKLIDSVEPSAPKPGRYVLGIWEYAKLIELTDA